MATVVCGLAAVVSASPVLFAAIRWAGAAYLIVLGVRALRDGRATASTTAERNSRCQAAAGGG
ncbi:LysE family transporter [Micromonospora sp. HM134]|uniref:LysE family transporter n=1 Tax=Micromonospora sp. HM134 TaxID=2583243 RepID=UPI00351B23C0